MWQESALSRWEHDRCQAADAWASATCGLLAITLVACAGGAPSGEACRLKASLVELHMKGRTKTGQS